MLCVVVPFPLLPENAYLPYYSIVTILYMFSFFVGVFLSSRSFAMGEQNSATLAGTIGGGTHNVVQPYALPATGVIEHVYHYCEAAKLKN